MLGRFVDALRALLVERREPLRRRAAPPGAVLAHERLDGEGLLAPPQLGRPLPVELLAVAPDPLVLEEVKRRGQLQLRGEATRSLCATSSLGTRSSSR